MATQKHNGSPCHIDEMQIRGTEFTVISVQSAAAKETVQEKLKKLILSHAQISTENLTDNR